MSLYISVEFLATVGQKTAWRKVERNTAQHCHDSVLADILQILLQMEGRCQEW
jgi:hypothetical protein